MIVILNKQLNKNVVSEVEISIVLFNWKQSKTMTSTTIYPPLKEVFVITEMVRLLMLRL